jgi:hypothetical protein
MAMDCIACAVMPTAAWLTPVAVQNRITRSCAVPDFHRRRDPVLGADLNCSEIEASRPAILPDHPLGR